MALSGGQLRFEDQAGRVNVETVLAQRADGLVTETRQSPELPTGTRWDYSILGADAVAVQNLSDGRRFTMTRCPGGGTPGQAARGEARGTAFIQQYYATWSGDAATALAFAERSYAPEINYYGKPTSQAAVLAAKAAFVARWPIRAYAVVPGSFKFQCRDSTDCTIMGTVDWTCRSTRRNAVSSGLADFTLRVSFSGETPLVLAETGSVTSRRSSDTAPVKLSDPARAVPLPDSPPGPLAIELPPVRP